MRQLAVAFVCAALVVACQPSGSGGPAVPDEAADESADGPEVEKASGFLKKPKRPMTTSQQVVAKQPVPLAKPGLLS